MIEYELGVSTTSVYKLYNEEVTEINALKNKTLDHETACRIRAYANALLNKVD